LNPYMWLLPCPSPKVPQQRYSGQTRFMWFLKGCFDFEEEKKRIRKEIKKIEKDYEISRGKLSNPQFMERAPEEIIESVREKVESMNQQLEKLNRNLRYFFESLD
jgi:valyl-tRNA synthetase